MLVTQRPEAAAALLMQLCTAGEAQDDYVAEVASFTHLFDERYNHHYIYPYQHLVLGLFQF